MRAARVAVAVTFAINGLLYGAWAARIPAIADRLGLGSGVLGVALACIPAGALVAMPLAGRAAARWGSRPCTRAALAAFTATTAVVALAPSLAALCVLAAAMGASAGALDVSMNANGVVVERRMGRPVLSSFHAAFSFGGLAGAAIGALSAAAGIDARVQLAVCAAACAAVGVPWTRRLLGPEAEGGPVARNAGLGEPPRSARRRLIALGLLAFCCLLCEGAAADWSAVYVDRALAASAAVAALAYTAFSLAMAFGRLAGDGLTARVGSVALVRRGAVVAAAGMGAALLAGRPAAALVGFACLGAGLATIIPAVFRAAATIPGTRSAPSLAAVSTTGYLGFVAGPPLIGALAEVASLPVALAALPALAVLIALAARVVRPAQAEPAYLLSDLDGVLVDSGDAVERAWRWWAADRGVDFAVVEDAIHGRPSREVVACVAPGSDPAAESERIERFQATDLEGVCAVPGARELLESWPAERVAVVTSASEPLAHARLRHAGVPVPATMVTVEQVANGKPAPDGYLAAAAALGADPERCIVLEDAPAGVRAGRAAGMRVVAVLTTHRRDELPGAAAYVDDLRGVADLIS